MLEQPAAQGPSVARANVTRSIPARPDFIFVGT